MLNDKEALQLMRSYYAMPQAQRRDQLVSVATEVFSRSGYRTASMDAVAIAAGVPVIPATEVLGDDFEAIKAEAAGIGYPLMLKASWGGGGRGMRPILSAAELPEKVREGRREAEAAFGNGEGYLEKMILRARHVEVQLLGDTHGGLYHLYERDCTVQRRNQKVVERAPAPYLTPEQRAEVCELALKIGRAVGYQNAGTVEFLMDMDSQQFYFIEVNPRVQVEHPVTEEVTGIDLVREMLRIADGEELGYDDPIARGHSFEFRINGEDAGRNFMPAPGTVTRMRVPQGPGVRWDAGIEEGDTVAGAFDSMIAKLIVSGATRQQALERSRRALDELVVDGMPTVVPFHQAIVRDPAFAPEGDEPFSVYTRWIETEFDNQIAPYGGEVGEAAEDDGERQKITVEVGGKRLEVVLPGGLSLGGGGGAAAKKKAPKRSGGGGGGAAASGDSLTAPMQGTIVKLAVEEGQEVAEGDLVVVLEAMKMEHTLTAARYGTVAEVLAAAGDQVEAGAALIRLDDDEASA